MNITIEQYLEDIKQKMMGRVYLRTKQLQLALKDNERIHWADCSWEEVPQRSSEKTVFVENRFCVSEVKQSESKGAFK